MSALDERCCKLDQIVDTARAIVAYARSLSENADFVEEGTRFVLRPTNFVTFSVHHKRACNLTASLRGNVSEFEHFDELELRPDQNGYCSFKLTDSSQLFAAASYIRRAQMLYQRGRERSQTQPKTVEA